LSNFREVYPNPMHTLSLTLDFFSSYPLFKLTETEPTEIYRNKQLSYTHNNMCLNVCQVSIYTQKRYKNITNLLYLYLYIYIMAKLFIVSSINNNYSLIECFLWKMFQDLEPDSVYVKIIEYSIAGKCFLTSDIWEKILLKNRSSALKKFVKSIYTFKVCIYFVYYIMQFKMYRKTHKLSFRKHFILNHD